MTHKPSEFVLFDGTYRCPFCDKQFSKMGICSHVWRHEGGKGFAPIRESSWNKGKTKFTDERIAKGSQTLSAGYASGRIIPSQLGKPVREDVKEKIRATTQRKIAEGTWHVSFSHSRTHEYKGMKFHGKWELAYAQWLDANGTNWRRPTESFPYEWRERTHHYTPDFYLIDEGVYIEVKGYETERDRAKWSQFPLKLRVLRGKDLFELKLIDNFKKM